MTRCNEFSSLFLSQAVVLFLSYLLELLFPRCCNSSRKHGSFDDHTVSFSASNPSSFSKEKKVSETTHLLFMDQQKLQMQQDYHHQYEFVPKENEFLRTIP